MYQARENISRSEKTDITPLLLLILSVTLIPAAYVFVAAVFIVQMMENKLMLNLSKSSILIYVYITIGLIASKYKIISFFYALLMALCLYANNIFTSSLNYYDLRKLKNILYIVSILVFLYGIIQYLNPTFTMPNKWVDKSEYNLSKRIYSTFFNPNIFGFYCNFIILLASQNLKLKNTNLQWLVFITGLGCLILTFSRTAWISLIAAFLLMGLFNKKYFAHGLIISIVIFSFDALLGVGRTNPSSVVNDSSFLYRFEIWKSSMEIIKDNFILGIGFGTLFKYIQQYSDVVSPYVEHCHNVYIQVFMETGILGFSIFLILISKILINLYKKLKEKNNEVWITALGVFTMSMIHGLVDSVLLTPQIMMIMSIYIGNLILISKKNPT